MFILYTIKDLFSLTAHLDNVHLPQAAQMVRHSRFADADRFSQRSDVHLTADQQRENAHAAGVAEGAEKFGYVGSNMFIENTMQLRVSPI